MIPISIKTLISKPPLAEDELMDELLKLSKQDIASIRKTCCFSIDRAFPEA